MSKHTPGYLRIRNLGDERQFAIENLDGSRDAERWEDTYFSVSGYFGSYGPAMFAAAPDMLAALHDALQFVADQEDVTDGADGQPVANRAMTLAQTLRAAIAKAEGGAA